MINELYNQIREQEYKPEDAYKDEEDVAIGSIIDAYAEVSSEMSHGPITRISQEYKSDVGPILRRLRGFPKEDVIKALCAEYKLPEADTGWTEIEVMYAARIVGLPPESLLDALRSRERDEY